MVAALEVHNPQPSRPIGVPASGSDHFTPIRRRQATSGFRLFRRLLAAVIVAGSVAGGVFVYRTYIDTAPPHPKEWDPRVAGLASFVESERGLVFKHPIYLDFLDDTAYAATITPEVTSLDDATVEDASIESDLLDAFTLTAGYDAVAGQQTFDSVSTLGVYTPSTDRITLRGTQLTPALKVVVVHELTHALQEQYFGLHLDGGDDLSVRSIAEADAMRVESAYLAGLTPDEQAAVAAENAARPNILGALGTLPWPVVELHYAPYRLGPTLLATVYARSGNAGVDALLRNPPPEEVLISPWKYQMGETDVQLSVAAPKEASVVHGSRPLSMMRILVMLDAWLPWSMARGALDGWAGGAYVTYHRGGSKGALCFTATAVFDNSPDQFLNALTWWAAASGTTTSPTVNGNSVTFESCARGLRAIAPPVPVLGPGAEIRLEYASIPDGAILTTQASAMPFLCTARTMIDDPTAAPLLASFGRTPDQQAEVDRIRLAAAAGCGF